MRARRIAVVPHPAEAMFALVDDIESYPQFLNWCERAEVSRDGENVRAALHVRRFGIRTFFATENVHCQPRSIDMHLAGGPLRSLRGRWEFADLGDGRSRVEFFIEFHAMPGPLGRALERIFEMAFDGFVRNFAERARTLYGENDGRLSVTVACAESGERALALPPGSTVGDALAAAGREDAELVGVFGAECERGRPLAPGDRVEIYRRLPRDPREARRERAARRTAG